MPDRQGGDGQRGQDGGGGGQPGHQQGVAGGGPQHQQRLAGAHSPHYPVNQHRHRQRQGQADHQGAKSHRRPAPPPQRNQGRRPHGALVNPVVAGTPPGQDFPDQQGQGQEHQGQGKGGA